jgi:phospholipid/cholesterol/gamma-HCH transport system permease protein
VSIITPHLIFLGGATLLTKQILQELFRGPFHFKLFLEQLYEIGLRSLPLIFVVALSVGMVMALQFGVGLGKFGGSLYTPKVVSVAIIRELGPIFASLMMAARVGAGITSEVGSMTVTQQIDAIRALGNSPIQQIVIPRVLATLVGLPLLVVLANALGVLGGLIVGTSDLGLDPYFYYQKVITTVALDDYFSGFFKTFFFALFIAVPACYFGLNVRGGTQGVGMATTKAVVTSCILILVGDFVLTKLFMVLG